jgi:hypothetical protein
MNSIRFSTHTFRYDTSADKHRFPLMGRERSHKTHNHCSDHTSRYDTSADKHRFPVMGRECAIVLEKSEREKALDAVIGDNGHYAGMLKDIPDRVCKSLQCQGLGTRELGTRFVVESVPGNQVLRI